ncbi:SWIM zinc finger domain-containing protein [Exiguobacterium sp.]|uniref:SWIM zinc finger family protein n=1 Tax=Exiguobacterium sp. TaxID=44751 RepID=UPI00391ABCA5
MNLYDFESYVPKRIENRGYDYYRGGAIERVSEKGNTHTFDVYGSDVYRVVVLCANEWVIQSSCDCPYEKGTCKHEVAAFYLLRDRLTSGPSFDLETALGKLKKADLIDVVLRLARDPDVYHHLVQDLAPPRRLPETFMQRCEREIAEKFSSGIIPQQEIPKLRRYLFRKIDELRSNPDPVARLFTGVTFLHTVTPTIMMCDMFSELLWAVRDTVTDMLVSAIEEIPTQNRTAVFQRLILLWHELRLSVYNDVHVRLLQAIVPLYEGDKAFLIEQIDRFKNTHAEASDLEHLDRFIKLLKEEGR